jgi:hypothetical protein
MMNTAQASLEGLRYYYILARDLGYSPEAEGEPMDEIGRMLGAYARSLLTPAS